MSGPSFYGFQERQDGTVLVTWGCRPVLSVSVPAEVSRLCSELSRGDVQEVLARWAGRASKEMV
ncbi:hypothetical protein RKD30_003864 [Streptomyces pristinaespiralis]|jgi:hypothetical protein|uniref:Uncharacterized protein n=2 Tax=Streptomyces pristinaespiralis TaxID=38300 RepID=B5HAA2_STRE2|nr:hypothetical protein SPRI_3502 [Streptomyces pristinaespiralis]EDY63763.1 conserved hypothetical protein [Streptomyces pristinaespiralis ATCC 25486]